MGEDWQALGREVQRARMAAGMGDTKAWVRAVGRSDRILLGLERGEHVGPKTLTLVAEALGWPTGKPYDILNGRLAEQSFVASPGPVAEQTVTEQAILDRLDEIAQRVAEIERRLPEGGS